MHNASNDSWGHESWGDFAGLEWIQPRPTFSSPTSTSLSLAWIKKQLIIRSQPWMNWLKTNTLSLCTASEEKKYSWLSLYLNLYQWKKNQKKSLSQLQIFFVSNIFKAEKRQKFVKDRQKLFIFMEKVQFLASIHDLNTLYWGISGLFPWIRVVSASNFLWLQNFKQYQPLMY